MTRTRGSVPAVIAAAAARASAIVANDSGEGGWNECSNAGWMSGSYCCLQVSGEKICVRGPKGLTPMTRVSLNAGPVDIVVAGGKRGWGMDESDRVQYL